MGTEIAYLLSSIKNSTGKLQMLALFSGFPPFAFTRRAVARGAVDDFVAMDRLSFRSMRS